MSWRWMWLKAFVMSIRDSLSDVTTAIRRELRVARKSARIAANHAKLTDEQFNQNMIASFRERGLYVAKPHVSLHPEGGWFAHD